MTEPLRLGTRGSQLALWQASEVASRIAAAGGPPCTIVTIKTTGDQLQERPLSEIGGKRLFVKEIEDALLRRAIDIAVHSSKDMPAVLPDGLAIGGVLPREDPLDAVVLPAHASGESPVALATVEDLVACLGQKPAIGTSSVRRIAQIIRVLPNARFAPIRGNLDTRLRKLDEGQYDVLILAAAGLRRLGFAHRISMALPAEVCVPAPGQGIVAVEARDDDRRAREAIARINDPLAAAALAAERSVVETLGGGCQTPIGALATLEQSSAFSLQESSTVPADSADRRLKTVHGDLSLIATVVAPDGSRALRAHLRGAVEHARLLGKAAGTQLLEEGAAGILKMAEGSGQMADG